VTIIHLIYEEKKNYGVRKRTEKKNNVANYFFLVDWVSLTVTVLHLNWFIEAWIIEINKRKNAKPDWFNFNGSGASVTIAWRG
jgi:hypothetical protein